MTKNRVIIWGVGNLGRTAIMMIQASKTLELVGAIDLDPKKIGKDAGKIFGLPKTGVIVSSDVDAILALDAEVVLLYIMPLWDKGDRTPTGRGPTAEVICKALRAKKNVVTSLDTYCWEETAPKLYEKVNNCALENGVTIVQQGIYPGLFNPYLPVVMASLSGKLEKIVVTLMEDDTVNSAPWARTLSFGKTVEEINSLCAPLPPADVILGGFFSMYGGTTRIMAKYSGLEYDKYIYTHEMVTAKEDFDTFAYGKIKKGTVSAHILKMSCIKNGEEVTGFYVFHMVRPDMHPQLPQETSVEIFGIPHMKFTEEGMVPHVNPQEYATTSNEYLNQFCSSAAPSVNLIPQTVEAKPGFLDALELRVTVPVK